MLAIPQISDPMRPDTSVTIETVGISQPIPAGAQTTGCFCFPNAVYRQYNFNMTAGGLTEQIVVTRYSELARVLKFQNLCTPNFPSNYPFKDMNTEGNAAIRLRELMYFLGTLFNQTDTQMGGFVTSNAALRGCLGISDKMYGNLIAISNVRREVAEAARRAEQARRAAILAAELADRDFAQEVNRYQAPAGQVPTIMFGKPLNFALRAKMFSFGNRDQVFITGPGGHNWFGMMRANTGLLNSMDITDTEVVGNLRGEPLLVMHRQFSWWTYIYRICRIVPGYPEVPICTVTRVHQLFGTPTYVIEMHCQGFGGAIYCQGAWTQQFCLFQDGVPACNVAGRFFSFPETYDVQIHPQRDVLLFLGIACAIDHIHHEIEKNHSQ